MLGQRSHWMFVKDITDTNTLYAMQAIWMDDAPITELFFDAQESSYLLQVLSLSPSTKCPVEVPIG